MFEFSVKRPVAVTVIMTALVILGVYFGNNLKLELIPTLDIPVAAIITTYPGAGPSEVEEQISKKIEDQVGSVENLKKVTSTSQDNVSIVIAEFYYGTDMIQAMSDVRDKVEVAKRNLPDEADNPTIYKVDPNSRPIITLAMKGNMDLRSLRDLADDEIKKAFEKVAGVASVTISGGYEREIAVLVDPGKLEKFNIAPSKVISAIQLENINVPGGNILTKEQQIQVRTVGQLTDVDEIKNIYIDDAGDRRIYVRDVAKVNDTNKEQESITRVNDIPCVTIEIIRNNDANIASVCDACRAKAEELNKILPEGTEIVAVKDDSDMIKKSLSAMIETAIEAMVLAVLVIFMFLSNFRSTIIVSLSIPISIFATFTVMHFNDFSLNIITMSAFTLAIGRVIDDSIVVLENIFRYLENGYDPYKAAVDATKEVGLAIVASTLTTMSVFLPLLLLKGIVGQFFIPLAMTFMTALLVSLVVAVLLVPMLSSRILKLDSINKPKKGIKIITVWFNNIFKKLETTYRHTLDWSIHHRWITLIIAVALFFVSLVIFATASVAFQPQMDMGVLTVTTESPVGSSLQKTNEYIKQIEKIAKEEFGKETKYLVAVAGSGSAGGSAHDSIAGNVTLRLIDKKDRPGTSAIEMRRRMRERLKEIPGLIYNTSIQQGGRQTPDIELIIRGDDLDELARLGEMLKKDFSENVKGAEELDLGWKKGKPEYRIIVDKTKAGQYGINLYNVGAIVSTYVMGTQVADVNKYKENERDYDITIQLDRENRDTKDKLEQLPIRIDDKMTVPLSSIAEIVPDEAPSKITRDSRERSLSIKGSAAQGYQNNDVLKGMINYLKEHKDKLPDGYTWRVGGEEEDRADAFKDLISSLVLAIFIVYVILAIQFESFIHPFTIMMAVPLELIGVSIALMVTGEPVSMVVMLGVILLTGIVVSNSILLVNYINVLREKGEERTEAILKAGPIRLRPIIMTATATCIAMIPLALGMREGAEFFAPLGKVVIGGLISSTFLTLLVVPCVYSVMDDISIFLSGKNKKSKKEEPEKSEEPAKA